MSRAERRIAAFAALIAVAIPLIVFMPWSGAADMPISAAGQAATLPPSPSSEPIETIPPVEEEKTEEQEYIPDAAEVAALAKMLYGEARGVASDMEKAACVWCVLNRVDNPQFPDTVLEVLEAPYQFSGYSRDYPVLPELEALAADVLTRYHAERDGEENVGRVLPPRILFLHRRRKTQLLHDRLEGYRSMALELTKSV